MTVFCQLTALIWRQLQLLERICIQELEPHRLTGSDLALAIRRENPTQRVTVMTNSASMRPSVRRKLDDIPILKLKNLQKIKAWDLPSRTDSACGEGQTLIDRVETARALQTRRKKTANVRL